MTYELARQLSDAGFPFVPIAAAPLTRRGRDFIAFADGPSYHEPSLTELIDECRQFYRLSHETTTDRWSAQGAGFIGEGNDAEEAVARLWLQLQKAGDREGSSPEECGGSAGESRFDVAA